MPNKTCTKCDSSYPLTQFHRDRSKKDGYRTHCKSCCRETYRKYYTPSRVPEYKDRELRKRYGLSYQDYVTMVRDQNGCCKICGTLAEETCDTRIRNLAVDHDHETGQVRGLLCQRCNLMIGYADDSCDVLKTAIQYLGGG